MPTTRNIWCFDKRTGERLWVIEEITGKEKRFYTGAGYNEEEKLKVSSIGGLRWDLDPETGKTSNAMFTK